MIHTITLGLILMILINQKCFPVNASKLSEDNGSGDYIEFNLSAEENDSQKPTFNYEQIPEQDNQPTIPESQIDSQGPPPFIPPPPSPDPNYMDIKGPIEEQNMIAAIPMKGEKGERGERGETGEKGECSEGKPFYETPTYGPTSCHCNISQIISSHQIKGPKGDTGPTGPPGPPGPPGRGSTFEADVSPGFFGGPGADFPYLAQVGEPGLPGPRGLPGYKGERGEPGLTIKGERGERGKKGKTGKHGIPGQAGPIGPPGEIGKPGPKGDVGPPGSPGLPGLPGLPGPPGEPPIDWYDNSISGARTYRGIKGSPVFTRHESETQTVFVEGPPGPPGEKGDPGSPSSSTSPVVVPSAIAFKDMESLLKTSSMTPSGTLAFISDEQALLLRVSGGWQYVALGSMVQTNSDFNIQGSETTTAFPQTVNPHIETLLEKSYRHHNHKKLRMAALNNPLTGDFHGIRGADYECYRQSRSANMRGTFRAFIASKVQNLDSIVRYKDAKLPIVNIKGEIIFNSWKDLFTGAMAPFPFPPKIYSFDGRNVLTDYSWPQKLVWHGADRAGVRNSDAYCDAWNSNSMSKVGMASSLLRGKLLDQEKYSCNNPFIVLCIEATSPEEAYRQKRQTRDQNFNSSDIDINEID